MKSGGNAGKDGRRKYDLCEYGRLPDAKIPGDLEIDRGDIADRSYSCQQHGEKGSDEDDDECGHLPDTKNRTMNGSQAMGEIGRRTWAIGFRKAQICSVAEYESGNRQQYGAEIAQRKAAEAALDIGDEDAVGQQFIEAGCCPGRRWQQGFIPAAQQHQGLPADEEQQSCELWIIFFMESQPLLGEYQ